MSDTAIAAVALFPLRISRLERIPDELTLRIGFCLAALTEPPNARRPSVAINNYLFTDWPH